MKTGWIKIGGLAILALGFGCGRHPLDAGIEAIERKQFQKAVPLLQLAIQQNPNDASAQANLGIATLALNDTNKALIAFKRAADLAPDDPRPLEFSASILAGQNRWKEASDALVSALKRSPRSPRVMTALALAELRTLGPQAARIRLSDTLAIAPNYSPAIYDLALIEKDWLHNPEAADSLFRRYLKVAPSDPRADAVRAALGEPRSPSAPPAAADKRPRDAARRTTPASAAPAVPAKVRNVPAATEAFNQGVRHHTSGNLEQAAAAYALAIERNPEWADAHYNLGLVYESQGNLAAARSAFERTVTLAPDMIGARYMLALVYQKENNDAAAIDELVDLLKKAPRHAEAHLALGLLYRKNQAQQTLARAELTRYLELKPDGAQANQVRDYLKYH